MLFNPFHLRLNKLIQTKLLLKPDKKYDHCQGLSLLAHFNISAVPLY